MTQRDSSRAPPDSLEAWVKQQIPQWERQAKADREYRKHRHLEILGWLRQQEQDQLSRLQLQAQREVNRFLRKFQR